MQFVQAVITVAQP